MTNRCSASASRKAALAGKPACPMPDHWPPLPEKTKTMASRPRWQSPGRRLRSAPRIGKPRQRCGEVAPCCGRQREAALACGSRRRPVVLAMIATSRSAKRASRRRSCRASAARARSASPLWAETNARRYRPDGGVLGPRLGGITTWALVPPKPKELTPANCELPSEREQGDGSFAKRQIEIREIDVRIGFAEVQGARKRSSMVERQHRFHEPGKPGRRLEVADIGLDRSDRQRRNARAAETAPSA